MRISTSVCMRACVYNVVLMNYKKSSPDVSVKIALDVLVLQQLQQWTIKTKNITPFLSLLFSGSRQPISVDRQQRQPTHPISVDIMEEGEEGIIIDDGSRTTDGTVARVAREDERRRGIRDVNVRLLLSRKNNKIKKRTKNKHTILRFVRHAVVRVNVYFINVPLPVPAADDLAHGDDDKNIHIRHFTARCKIVEVFFFILL